MYAYLRNDTYFHIIYKMLFLRIYHVHFVQEIEEWLKREVVRDRSLLQTHPSILKYITGYRDSVDEKQVVKVFLCGDNEETKTFFKDYCANSENLQFDFVNVEK